MKFLILSVLLFVILFFPIPIVIKFSYVNKTLSLKIWKFNLLKNRDTKKLDDLKNDFFNITSKDKDTNLTEKRKKFTVRYKKLLSRLHKNPFKIKLKLSYNLDYSLEDAAMEAITYGLLWDVNTILVVIFNNFFKFIPIKCVINPNFKNLTFFNFTSKSILSVSLGQIIFIALLIISCVRRCPKRG